MYKHVLLCYTLYIYIYIYYIYLYCPRYYVDPSYQRILFPTLSCIAYQSAENLQLMETELSRDMIGLFWSHLLDRTAYLENLHHLEGRIKSTQWPAMKEYFLTK